MTRFELSVDVTYKCPFSCPFCSSSQDKLLPDLDADVAQRCLDFANNISNAQDGEPEISITGGEPLILSNLPSLISLWATGSNKVILCTTGALDLGKGYWQDLRSCGLQTVRLSLHSVLEDGCQAIFGSKYSFATVDRNIELIMAAGMNVQANFLASRSCIGSFNNVWAYCLKKGIEKIRVLGLSKQGRAINNWNKISVSEQEKALFVGHISELCAMDEISVEFAGLPNNRPCSHSDENGRCLGGISFFHINTDGDIYACPALKSIAAERIGSVLQPSPGNRVGSGRFSNSTSNLTRFGSQCRLERVNTS